jgi:hypothetical protein
VKCVVCLVLSGFLLLTLVGCGAEDNSTPTFSLAGSSMTVVQGGSEKSAIVFNFSLGSKDIVSLSLESHEAGVTGTFEPATVSATSPRSLLSVNVAATVAAGNYELTVKGSSGARVNTAKVQLVVKAATNTPDPKPTPTFTLEGTSLTVVQGDLGLSRITANFETGFTDTVALSLEAPVGITGTFDPTTLTPSVLNSDLLLEVAASVAPGSYNLTVKGMSATQSKSATLVLVVEEAVTEDTEIFTPPSMTDFSITLRINGTLSTSQRETFVAAAQRWSSIITTSTGLEDITIAENTCGAGFPAFSGTITNLLIDVRIREIDGEDGILGQAGPCLLHEGNGLTVYGIMEFDVADVAGLETANQFDLVILHEMGHVLGFGTLWEDEGRDLLDEPCRTNPGATSGFKGSEAVMQFGVLGEIGNPPVENDYGPGTRCGHWDEGFFDNELMTGFLGGVTGPANPLSALTIASMADLGYTVDVSEADTYSVPSCSSTCDSRTLRLASSETAWEIILEPKGTIDTEGTIRFFEDDR